MGRSKVEPVSEAEKESMDSLMEGVMSVVDGHDCGLVLSILSQAIVGNIGDGGSLSEAEFMARTVAMLSLINIMRDGKLDREYDQVSHAEAVDDLWAILKCGSRSIMVPAVASVLVASVANGRSNEALTVACLADIKAALERFDSGLGS